MNRQLPINVIAGALIFLCSVQPGFSQSGTWTWIKGDSVPLSYGSYGQQGTASPVNNPPALYEAANWTDADGNFWLFGGVHYQDFNMYSDLWKFDVYKNQWIWVKGSGIVNQPGNYGVQGIPATGNNPGARAWGIATWVDPDGNLWLFGGTGIDHAGEEGRLNDLWKYSIEDHAWTWMKGDQSINGIAEYGTLGIESPDNKIPSRDESSCTWSINNEFWIFGGVTNAGLFNDMWRYNWFTNNWTWMKGGEQLNREPVHGLLNVADEQNDPGGRFAYCSWLNCDGKLLFFGGENSKAYNDLWSFDRASNLWTWVDGNNYPNNFNYFGEFCEDSEAYNPAARTENRARWNDEQGNLWVFGGLKTVVPAAIYSDLWRYNPANRTWALVHGNTQPNLQGHYGEQQVSAPGNYPRNRAGAVSWKDSLGNFWIFGGLSIKNDLTGYPFVTLNDLWRYQPDPDCFQGSACDFSILPELSISDTALCAGQCIDFISQAVLPGSTYTWFFEGAEPETSTLAAPEGICYLQTGSFGVTLIATKGGVSDTLVLPELIHVYNYPDTPNITVAGNVLTATPANFYQWQLNGVNIPGANKQSYTAGESGIYTVITTNKHGCWNQSSVSFELIPQNELQQPVILISPNLTNATITVSIAGHRPFDPFALQIYNLLGQQLYDYHLEQEAASVFNKTVDLSMLPSAAYFVFISSGSLTQTEKIVVIQ